MTLRDGALLLAEILVIFSKILYYMCENVYKLFAPVKRKSVGVEIVLVRTKFTIHNAQLWVKLFINGYRNR